MHISEVKEFLDRFPEIYRIDIKGSKLVVSTSIFKWVDATWGESDVVEDGIALMGSIDLESGEIEIPKHQLPIGIGSGAPRYILR